MTNQQELQAITIELARMSRVEYDQSRRAVAKRFDLRVTTLDALVDEARLLSTASTAEGVSNCWPEPVDGDELLIELQAMFERHLVLGARANIALPLWAVFTHALDCGFTNPRLIVFAPEKRCGKSTVLRLLNAVVRDGHVTSNMTAAALYRWIEQSRPTLLIDEAGQHLSANDAFKSILNSGLGRDTAFVDRTNPITYEPEQFSTWAPIGIALIGRLWDTLEDRSIMVPMRRKLPSESVERLDETSVYRDLGRKAARWVKDNEARLREHDPSVPETLNDRAQDVWRPLLRIADVVGGEWPSLARQAAIELSRINEDEDSERVELLRDIRLVFSSEGVERLATRTLIDRLSSLEESRWSPYRSSHRINPRQLSDMLRPFGIRPASVRDGQTTFKGYKLEDFQDAFARYLPPESVPA